MEECTLRSCVDRFNNRRYLSGQLNALHRNAVPNNANVQGGNTTGTTATNMSNQMAFTGGNIGGNGPNNNAGLSTNGNNGLNGTNGLSNNCISQSSNINGPQQAIVINELNEQYESNGLIDVAVNSLLLNSGQDKNLYANGYGGWNMENVDLSDEFKKHYEVWLQKEVFNIKIEWDSVMTVYDIADQQ